VRIWVDAQPSPALATWMSTALGVEAMALRDLGLRDAEDSEIFERACAADVIVFTKDHDFLEMLRRRGPPPRILWLSAGNSSNEKVRALLTRSWPRVCVLFDSGEPLVELRDRS
jgi:predicted nuclease of predicted toxin-antitoxin system